MVAASANKSLQFRYKKTYQNNPPYFFRMFLQQAFRPRH